MSDAPTTGSGPKRSMGAELIIPAVAILFTLYYFTTIWNSPWTAQVSAFFIGTILIVLSAAFIVRSGILVFTKQADLGFGDLVSAEDIRNGRLALFGLTLIYVIVIEWGGFTLTTLGFLFLSMLILNKGRRLGLVTFLSLAITLAGYLLFIVAFQTRFPRGPFENLMDAVF